jgi:hypothetical protein
MLAKQPPNFPSLSALRQIADQKSHRKLRYSVWQQLAEPPRENVRLGVGDEDNTVGVEWK